MRRQPAKELQPIVIAPDLQQDNGSEVFRQERRYEVITPLYGGGALPNECDPITVIRGTEIRGQLRFWWRACFAGRYKTFMELKKAEDAIWGKASEKSKANTKKGTWQQSVQIYAEIVDRKRIQAIPPFETKKQSGEKKWEVKSNPLARTPDYAAFPLRPREETLVLDEKPFVASVYLNVSFVLEISFAKEKSLDVETALWAWETFGGVGARTRRGFGAIQLTAINGNENKDLPSSAKAIEQIRKKLTDLNIPAGGPIGVPSLDPEQITSLKSRPSQTQTDRDSYEIWDELIKNLFNFRQGSTRQNKGRNKWPEAQAIRALLTSHSKNTTPVNKFPRAVLGLPIVFHFKENKPAETTLQVGPAKSQGRLASPLILRPLASNDGFYIGMAAFLKNSQPDWNKLALIEKETEKVHPVSAQLQGNEHSEIVPLMGEADALKAFQKYLEKRR